VSTQGIEPQPGRRPVYPVDADKEGDVEVHPAKPVVPAEGSKDDPASDENTDSANHPNDE
jgi:hypothetical protein